MIRLLVFPLLALLAGCTSFQGGRPVETLPAPLPPEERVEVWAHGESYQLHAVQIDADSLVGVRWWHSPDCDSCRVAIARSAIDSVRTKRYDGGATGTLAIIVAPILLVWYVFSQISRS